MGAGVAGADSRLPPAKRVYPIKRNRIPYTHTWDLPRGGFDFEK
jgi:hypothetical protein